jgi:VWFA-related protein
MPSCKKFVAAWVTSSLALALAAPALTQEPAAQGPVIKTQVNLVNLFVTVRDKKKKIITDLKQENFSITEDNEPQKIAFFSKEVTQPITLGLLIDTSGSEQNRLGAEQEAASRFLGRVMRKGDEGMVISFDTDVDLLADFTDDLGILDRAIRKARTNVGFSGGPLGSSGRGTALYDAIYVACGEKLATEAGRKAIVIITDADDQGSKVRLEEAIEAAQRTDTVIHVLLVHDPGYGFRPDVAKKMSDETGGRVIEVSSEKRLSEAFDQISEELRSQYTLGYYPSNPARDGKFRKIKIDTTDHELHVLARKGYYAPKG